MNQFDQGDDTIEADINLYRGNDFRIKKLRRTEGKFDKRGVQGLVEVCLLGGMSHLSDFGNEQNVLLPLDSRRQFCKIHIYLNIHTYLTDENRS